MSNQHFNSSSEPTLAKLLEVDSQLAVREAELLAQLEGVQSKRRSLKTVVSLFATAQSDTAPVESPVQTPPTDIDAEPETVGQVAALQLDPPSPTTTAESETEAPLDTQSKAARTTVSPTRSNKNTRVTQVGNAATRQSSGWQQYLRAEFRQTSLPEAVHLVLQRQSEQVFEISAVLNAIFAVHLPDEVQSRVRRQIANILSEGARNNRWYRDQLGCYSMSRAAESANSASLK